MDDVPLIWTSKGNVPISSLANAHSRADSPEETTFVEEYRLGEEVVKRSVHVYSRKGNTMTGVAGGLHG